MFKQKHILDFMRYVIWILHYINFYIESDCLLKYITKLVLECILEFVWQWHKKILCLHLCKIRLICHKHMKVGQIYL